MNRFPAIAHLVAVAFIATGSAFAQDHHGVKASVPFNFIVNGSSLPAGVYTITSDVSSTSRLVISSQDEKACVVALGMIVGNEPGKTGSLIFHKYGERYFLSEIRYAHSWTKVDFPPSRTEKKAKQRTLEADLNSAGDVLIALN